MSDFNYKKKIKCHSISDDGEDFVAEYEERVFDGIIITLKDGRSIHIDTYIIHDLNRMVDYRYYREDVETFLRDEGLQDRLSNKPYINALTERYILFRENEDGMGSYWEDMLRAAFNYVKFEEFCK